jgi:hypothetical protein
MKKILKKIFLVYSYMVRCAVVGGILRQWENILELLKIGENERRCTLVWSKAG